MRQIVCLASHPWSSHPSRTQQLMVRMKETQILYFSPARSRDDQGWREPGRELRPGLIAYTLPPAPNEDLGRGFLFRRGWQRSARFLQTCLERHRFREPLLWCDSPAGADYLSAIAYRGLVYDCAQIWPAHQEAEVTLAGEADVVFAASPELAHRLSLFNSNVALLPFGCNYPMFAKDDLPRPAELKGLSGPLLGHVGTLWPDLDLTPALTAARSHPDCSLVLLGEDRGGPLLPRLLELPNVRWLGPVEPLDLPDYLCAFQVCLYLLRRSERDVIHSRLFEYLSSGKPIVAMLRPGQVEHFPDVVYGAQSPAEFSLLCGRALTEQNPWALERRREYGKAASWTQRAQQVRQILESIGLFA